MARDNPAGSAPSLVEYAQRLCTERLTAYSAARHDVEEHANLEELALGGGYAYRQVAELIQNAADAVSEDPGHGGVNRIEILADRYGLWAANTGAPVDEAGVRALLNAASSNKRASQIGRFGLGFKSLLLLGGNIDVISRPVWLHFDPAATRDRIRTHLGLAADAPAPGLRLADAGEWAEGLAGITQAQRFDWASTIVFASIESQAARLAIFREIREFPEEFLLFLPCDVELVLVVGDTRRHLRRRTDGDGCVVIEDVADTSSIPQRWRVFETVASIRDKAAIEDARQIHYRQAVPVIWAAPVGAPPAGGKFRETRTGKFFAFFPTSTESRAHGIINAPWKLNNDRTALVPGAWNNALMEEAAKLIAASITQLGSADDPGAVLDGFPREIKSESDPAAPLVRSMWNLLADAPVIPNCDGEYLMGSELLRHPTDSATIASAWSSLAPPEACVVHVHPTCLSTPARASRLNALAGRLRDRAKSARALEKSLAFDWLEMTATIDVDAAKDVIRLVDDFAQQEKGIWWEANRPKLRVIPTADDALETAANVVLGDHPEPPLRSAHPRLGSDREIRKILQETFHVRDKSDVKVIDHVDARIDEAARTGDWTPVWAFLRGLPLEDACRIIRRRPIRVRTLVGWAVREGAYRKGELVTDAVVASVSDEDRAAAAAMIVDDKWHARDHGLLDEMGIEPNPDPSWRETSVPNAPETAAQQWLADWRDEWREKYFVHLGCRVERGQLLPADFWMPHGWEWLLLAGGAQRQHVTHWLMEAVEIADEEELRPVEFHHVNRFAYTSEEYPHPAWSLLCEHGELAQKDVALPFSALLAEDMTERAALLPSLQAWEVALSKLEAAGSGWHNEDNPQESWRQWLDYASREECEPGGLAPFYERAATAGAVPQEVCSGSGPIGLANVYVTVSPRDAELASEAGLPTVALGKTAAALWIKAGARDLDKFRTTRWDDGEPEIVRLLEFEPTFSDILKPAAAQDACVSLVASLRQELGGQTLPVVWLLHDNVVLVDETDFRARGWTEQMCLLVEAASAAGWVDGDEPLAAILEAGPAARRRLVAAEPDLPSRLIKAVGDSNILLRLFEPEIHIRLRRNMQRTAELALRMFGPALLAIKVIREAMENQGLAPPKTWSGAAAADFVAAIGFPPEFAVAPQRKREAELSVSGPIPINPLHDFQEEVVANLDSLLANGSKKRRRAVISLPTGAGKTRVAAEMAVTRVLRDGGPNRLVLWVAQSDELCEQAVQCFRQLWANMGTEDEPLRIVRYWGSQTNPKAPEHDTPVVVVATIQTLDSRMGQPGTEWVRNPALVVIDECHHALTTSYTSIFRWLKPSDEDDREPPVIGLSATPFRGRNTEETQALARRFDGRLYPANQSELFEELQERGVLARFSYTKLEIRERLELSPEEIESLKKFKTLPTGAMERLGRMSDRNDRIVEAIEEADEKSALVFATSVNHAYRLAARLNLEGIRAAAVTGETDRNSRRWFIDAFRRGDIQVLCNHSALTTGFDAPATDLIVIARPVFSPSLYMQMVGRGLRGPVNGGKEECRILTIQDNLDQYTGMLAHHYFEQYYVSG